MSKKSKGHSKQKDSDTLNMMEEDFTFERYDSYEIYQNSTSSTHHNAQ